MSSPSVCLGDIPGIPKDAFSLFTLCRSFTPADYSMFELRGGSTLRLRGAGVPDLEFPLLKSLTEDQAAVAAGKAVLAINAYNRKPPGGTH